MNTIRIYLAESGRIADLKKDFPLYQGQFQNKLLNVYVPTSILSPDFTSQAQDGTITEFVASTGVKIGVTSVGRDGAIKKGKTRYMRYLKTLTHQGVEYALYERKMPKEFTLYAGQGSNAPTVAINIVNIQLDIDNKPQILSVVTSQECKLDVMPSSLLDADEMIENDDELLKLSADINEALEQLERKQDEEDERLETSAKSIVSAINENKSRIDINVQSLEKNREDISENRDTINRILSTYASAETFIATLSDNSFPSDEVLSNVTRTMTNREPKNGDVIIFILEVENATDRNFKYIYSVNGWSSYEIPPIEEAGNGFSGLVSGTYSKGSTQLELMVDISAGKIYNIYVKDKLGEYRNIVEYLNTTNENILEIIEGDTVVGEAMRAIEDSLGNNIVNTYLTKSLGATKQYVRDYAMPRVFNDVDFISSGGLQDDVPTTPDNGIQFSTTTNSVGDFQLFQVSKVNMADFELSLKNGYNNLIYVSANWSNAPVCKVTFRLTTEYKKVGEDWKTLNVELVNHTFDVGDEAQRIMFSGSFISLGEDVVTLKEGDIIRQTLDVITQTSSEATFTVYSNEVYPSTFTLTSQHYVPSNVEQAYGRLITLGVDGIIEANKVVFTVQDAESFEEYKTNQREFLVNGNLPIVGELDDALPVYITFGNTTYGVFSYMKGSSTPITIGELKSNMTYGTETGYLFTSKMIFLETSDYKGFAISPSTISAQQLENIIESNDSVVVDTNGTKLQIHLSADVLNRLQKTLITPTTKPTSTQLVAVDNTGSQQMVALGENLTIEGGKLNATGGGQSITIEDASQTQKGIVMLASDSDITDGINMTKAVTPAQLKGSIDLAVGNIETVLRTLTSGEGV